VNYAKITQGLQHIQTNTDTHTLITSHLHTQTHTYMHIQCKYTYAIVLFLSQHRFIIVKAVKELDGIDLLHISTRADELFKQERLQTGSRCCDPKDQLIIKPDF